MALSAGTRLGSYEVIAQIIVVEHWAEGLKRLVPTK